MTSLSEVRHRTYEARLRADTDAPALVTGYAVLWASRNHHGEIVVPGAYAAALATRDATKPLPIGWGHREPVGRWVTVQEDATGLLVEGQLSDTATGRDASTLLRDGAITGLSVGFRPTRWQWVTTGETVTVPTPYGTRTYAPDEDTVLILEAELVEISLVMVPSDDDARVLAVRHTPHPKEEAAMTGTATGAPDATAETLGALREDVHHLRDMLADRTPDPAPATRGTGYQPGDVNPDRVPVARPAEVLTRSDSYAGWASRHGIGDPDHADVRVGALIAAQVNPAARGILTGVEERALSEGLGSEGGFAVPEAVAAQVIDRVRNAARVIEAGAQVLPMTAPTVYYPRLSGAVAPTWKAEGDPVTEDDPTFERVTLTARTCAVLTRMSYELAEDITPAGLAAIENELVQALGVALDYAALRGTGTGGQPVGLVNTTGVTSVVLGGGADGATPANYDYLCDAVADVKGANHTPGAVLWNSTTEAVMAKLKTGITNDLTPLTRPAYLDPLRFLTTNQIPATLTVGASTDCSEVIVGDFSQMVIGMRPNIGVRVQRLTERYAENLQVALVAWLRADVMLAHPEAFHVTTGVRD